MPHGCASTGMLATTWLVEVSMRTTLLSLNTVAQAAPPSLATEQGARPTSIFARTSVALVAPWAQATSTTEAMIATAVFRMARKILRDRSKSYGSEVFFSLTATS